jgi:hypothetical protein
MGVKSEGMVSAREDEGRESGPPGEDPCPS